MPATPVFPSSDVSAALILAAGRGERMRPLTDHTPKPLLRVRGQPLMQWWVQALQRDGVGRIVVNTAWLGEKIEHFFGPDRPSSKAFALSNQEQSSRLSCLHFSHEGRDFGHALETAGGIARALPLLLPAGADAPADLFWVVAGDIFAPGFVFDAQAVRRLAASDALAHLWLVPNPAHNPQGDFGLDAASGLALNDAPPGGVRHTFSTIGLYKRALFAQPWCDIAPGNPQGQAAPLAPLLRRAVAAGRVSAQLYAGDWTDVGTPERLAALNAPGPLG